MHTTNYVDTLILVAPDSAATRSVVPAKPGSIAAMQYEMLVSRPYELTSDDLLFAVYAARQGVKPAKAPRDAFFSKPQACLRTSPLAKTHGFGLHHDAQGRVALVPMESVRYAELTHDAGTKTVAAMRSKSAKG
jgi:hypothetical protein